MYDLNAMVNESVQYNVPHTAYQVDAPSRATIYLISPVALPTQVLRPYIYNFTGNLVDQLTDKRYSEMRRVVAPKGKGKTSEDILKAIVPSMGGRIIDTHDLSRQWSFVLIINSNNSEPSKMGLYHSSQQVAVGYCSAEPVNPLTGTLNPNAVLQFTKSNVTTLTPGIGQLGTVDYTSNTFNSSIVDDRVNQLTNTSLHAATPGDLYNGLIRDPGAGEDVYNMGNSSLSNAGADGTARYLPSHLVPPTVQLNNIVGVIDAGIETGQTRSLAVSSDSVPRTADTPIDTAREEVAYNLPGSLLPGNTSQIQNTLLPISLQQLVAQYPDLKPIVLNVPPANPWDAMPQEYQTKRNAMCSMLAQSITAMLPQAGLMSICFRYDSWGGGRLNEFGMVDTDGVYDIIDYRSVIVCPPQQEKANLLEFMQQFKDRLVPVVRIWNGEFTLMANVDAMGTVMLDLIYLDDTQGYHPGDGWFSTNGQLGGWLNPMLADDQTFRNNATQLHDLVNMTTEKWFYRDNYGQPNLVMSSGAMPYNIPPAPTPSAPATPNFFV